MAPALAMPGMLKKQAYAKAWRTGALTLYIHDANLARLATSLLEKSGSMCQFHLA